MTDFNGDEKIIIFNFQKAKNAFLAMKWPFLGQPDNHIDSATTMPFASIYKIGMG